MNWKYLQLSGCPLYRCLAPYHSEQLPRLPDLHQNTLNFRQHKYTHQTWYHRDSALHALSPFHPDCWIPPHFLQALLLLYNQNQQGSSYPPYPLMHWFFPALPDPAQHPKTPESTYNLSAPIGRPLSVSSTGNRDFFRIHHRKQRMYRHGKWLFSAPYANVHWWSDQYPALLLRGFHPPTSTHPPTCRHETRRQSYRHLHSSWFLLRFA